MAPTLLQERPIEARLVISGKETLVELPELVFEGYSIRPMQPEHFHQIADLNDPALAEQFTIQSLEELTSFGYTFGKPNENGIAGAVAVDAAGKLVGRNTKKSWNGDFYKKPKFQVTEDGGLTVSAPLDFVDGAKRLVEIGGFLVSDYARGQGIGAALHWAAGRYVEALQRISPTPADGGFVATTGPFRSQDNPNGVDYAQRLDDRVAGKGIDLTQLDRYIGENVLTPQEVSEVFAGLVINAIGSDGTMKPTQYVLGMPREQTAPEQRLLENIASRKTLVNTPDGTGKQFAFPLENTGILHRVHGGTYFRMDVQ
jgi:hypothetical protein